MSKEVKNVKLRLDLTNIKPGKLGAKMNRNENKEILLNKLRNLSEKIASRSGLNVEDAGSFKLEDNDGNELALNLVFHTIKRIQREGIDSHAINMTRFLGEYNFDEDIYFEAAEIESFHRKIRSHVDP